jgi:methyltransferase (TIGR00027 family)
VTERRAAGAGQPLIRDIADTARWTAAYRAIESEGPDALFHDPYARRLAGERGFEIAQSVFGPVGLGVVLRTAVLDEQLLAALRDGDFDTVLCLGAGLDTRPYRLAIPAELKWIEADLPALIDYKEPILAGEAPRCSLERVRLDLADVEERRRLFARIGSDGRRVLVVTEGLLSYLEPEQVGELADDLHLQPSFAWWMTDITAASTNKRIGQAASEASGGRLRGRFAPEDGTCFFRPHGWSEVAFHSVFVEAGRLRPSFSLRVMRLVARLLPKAQRKKMENTLAIATLERVDG